MTKHDKFIRQELRNILAPGENVLQTAHVFQSPNMLLVGLLGPLAAHLLIKHYYAIATDRRIILIRTKVGFFGMKTVNASVESIEYRDIQSIRAGGFAHLKKIFITRRNGQKRILRINTFSRAVSGTKQFYREVSSCGATQAEPVDAVLAT